LWRLSDWDEEHADGLVIILGFEWVRKCLGVMVLSWFLAKDSGVVSFADDSINNHSEYMCSGVWWVLDLRDLACNDSSMEAAEQNRLWVWVMIVSMGVEG